MHNTSWYFLLIHVHVANMDSIQVITNKKKDIQYNVQINDG